MDDKLPPVCARCLGLLTDGWAIFADAKEVLVICQHNECWEWAQLRGLRLGQQGRLPVAPVNNGSCHYCGKQISGHPVRYKKREFCDNQCMYNWTDVPTPEPTVGIPRPTLPPPAFQRPDKAPKKISREGWERVTNGLTTNEQLTTAPARKRRVPRGDFICDECGKNAIGKPLDMHGAFLCSLTCANARASRA